MKAFLLLDPGCSMTVSRSELRRVIGTFLLTLTREQFQDLLAEVGSRHPGRQGGRRAGPPGGSSALSSHHFLTLGQSWDELWSYFARGTVTVISFSFLFVLPCFAKLPMYKAFGQLAFFKIYFY